MNGVDSTNANRTGLIDHKLHLMTKSDTDYRSDVMEKNVIGAKLKLYDCYNIATRAPITSRVDEPLSRSLLNINDGGAILSTNFG